jgi:tellurite resistance protein
MSIAVDQTRLRRISSALLPHETLDRTQALAVLEFARIAAGADAVDDPQEHTILQAVVQHVCSLAGLELDEATPIPRAPDPHIRLARLGDRLATKGARELAYAVALLVSVADLALVPSETANLEELQRALGVDDRRATDLTVFVAETVAAAA